MFSISKFSKDKIRFTQVIHLLQLLSIKYAHTEAIIYCVLTLF